MKKTNQAIPNKRLTHERTRHGWSQQNLADRVGTTPANVSRWERGVTTPNPYFRQQLVTIFEKSLEELGLPSQQSPLSEPEDAETVEQADYQSSPINDEQEQQDVAASLPTQEADIVSSHLDARELVPLHKPLDFLHPAVFSRHPLASLMVTLTSLALILAIIGMLWFNSTHSIVIGQGKGITSSTSAPSISAIGEPVPAFYHITGKSQLFSDDPLNSDITQAGWHISDPKHREGCHFINGSYDMKELANNYCLAENTSSVTDFVFQITMTLIKGPHAGIVFRVDDNHVFFYYFGIDTHGNYRVYYSTPATPDIPNPVIASGYSAFIHQGFNQPNVLGVKAIGPDISFYINSHLVRSVHDATYASGNLGVKVVIDDGYVHGTGETEATYNDAKLWAL